MSALLVIACRSRIPYPGSRDVSARPGTKCPGRTPLAPWPLQVSRACRASSCLPLLQLFSPSLFSLCCAAWLYHTGYSVPGTLYSVFPSHGRVWSFLVLVFTHPRCPGLPVIFVLLSAQVLWQIRFERHSRRPVRIREGIPLHSPKLYMYIKNLLKLVFFIYKDITRFYWGVCVANLNFLL